MNDESKELISIILAQLTAASERTGISKANADNSLRGLAGAYNGLLKLITHSSESPSVTIGRWVEANKTLTPWVLEGIFATCVVEPDDGPSPKGKIDKLREAILPGAGVPPPV